MDYLKELRKKIGGKISSQGLISANFKSVSTRELKVSNYKGFKLTLYDFGELLAIAITVNSEVGFSINRPDPTFLYNRPGSYQDLNYKLYLPELDDKITVPIITPYLSSLSDFLNTCRLLEDESVHIYSNRVYFCLHADRNISFILDAILGIMQDNPSIFMIEEPTVSISSENLPNSLKPLTPLLKKWAISDDSEREEARMRMRKATKSMLMKIVAPLMGEINAYLDSFENKPMPEEAILIGNLAELVSELQIE